MPTSHRTSRARLRRRRSGSLAPMLLCLSLAGLAALAVYRWGENFLFLDATATCSATAMVVDKSASAGGAARSTTPITGVAADRRQAVETAESLARRYVETRMSQWRRESESRRQAVRRQVAQAREEYAADMTRLTELKRQLALEAQTAARNEVAKREQKTSPAMIDNPLWKELNQRLVEQLQALERLSVNRTRQHPAVQEAEDRIAEVRSRLAAEPPLIPNPQPEAPPAFPRPDAASVWRQVVARVAADNQVRLDELSSAMERSRLACLSAEWGENLAEQKMQSPPRLAVRPATVDQNASLALADHRRLLWIAIGAGTIMAFGAMMLLRGTAIDPPLGSVGEARAMRGVAILGAIPAETSRPSGSEIGRQYLRRRMLIAAGTLLMLACPAAAAWCMLSI